MRSLKEIIKHKDRLIAQKKAMFKKSMGIAMTAVQNGTATKAADQDVIKVTGVGSSAWVYDSDKDVIVPGAWNKSVKEIKYPLLLEGHKMDFDSIIAEGKDVEYSVTDIPFKSIGIDADGDTEVLMFNAIVRRDVNEKMFDRYAAKMVNEHSVGFFYIKVDLAVNDPEYPEEYELWEKYITKAVNYDEAEANGYGFVVREGKLVEISAVLKGANEYTPTLTVEQLEKALRLNEQGNHSIEKEIAAVFKQVFN